MHDVRVGLCGFTTSMRSYARDFPVVEVQSTFYDPPRDDAMRKWADTAGAGLEYTMKVWQLVTHPKVSPDRPYARLLWEPRGAAWIAQRTLAIEMCRELDLVYVVDPFVTAPDPGASVYWRLHGPGSARSSYDDASLLRLQRMLGESDRPKARYVLFNNFPRVGDGRRFQRVLERSDPQRLECGSYTHAAADSSSR